MYPDQSQCDLAPLGCSQCSRRGISCHGYREVSGLRVVDESDRFACKNSRAARRQELNATRPSQRRRKLDHPLAISILPTLEDTAHSFFFTSYVPGSHFEYLSVIGRGKPLPGPLAACVQAVAVASFSNERQNPNMMKVALKHYSSALRDTNAAVTSLKNASQNSTIICVLLLGLFEALCHAGQENTRNFTAHNQGALALLELRGPELVKNQMGYQIFLQVSSNIRVSCIVNKKRVPARLIALHNRMIPYIDSEDPKVRFFTILDDFAHLQALIEEHNICNSLETASAASVLDWQCETLMATVRSSSHYTVHISDREVPFGNGREWHLYPDAHVAQWWNSVRQSRIYLNQIVLDQLASVSHEDADVQAQIIEMQMQAATIIQRLAAEICASVPHFASEINEKKSESDIAALASVSRLFFPLCTVGTSTVVPESLRLYVAKSLRFLGTATNFPRAVEAGKMIEEQCLDTSW